MVEEKIIRPVDNIVIDEEQIRIFLKPKEPKGIHFYRPREEFSRKEWNIIIDDAKQIQSNPEYASIVFGKDLVGCKVDEDKQTIFCGKKSEKMNLFSIKQ